MLVELNQTKKEANYFRTLYEDYKNRYELINKNVNLQVNIII